MMTVGELRAMIEGLSDDTVVKLATQPNYPFTYDVAGCNLVSPKQAEIEQCEESLRDPSMTPEDRAECEECLAEYRETPEVLYILEGGGQEYASRDLWNV